jgi:hypothetical protein
VSGGDSPSAAVGDEERNAVGHLDGNGAVRLTGEQDICYHEVWWR